MSNLAWHLWLNQSCFWIEKLHVIKITIKIFFIVE